jgi:protein involved in polysaccharide export with SLBB domain
MTFRAPWVRFFLAAVLPVPFPAGAQTGAPPRPVAGVDFGANLPAQALGAGDLLAVSVYGAPELTRTIRVGSDGRIRLPMLAHLIEARGRMPAELETTIGEALSTEGILVDPVVTVTVAEYTSRPISVAGEVRRPLTFQALGPTSLLEALTRAEGFTEGAGSEILITRRDVDSPDHPLIERVLVKNLIENRDSAANIRLEGGEEIRVPAAGRVFVVGNVKKPGAFRVESSGMTVLRALAMAEGLTPFPQKVAYIYRTQVADRGTDAKTTPPVETPVELRKIMDRKAADVSLEANDILYVPAVTPKGARPEYYFHFDSWRVNTAPGVWVPAQIYVEEEGAPGRLPRFKAQTRIWDVGAAPAGKLDELTRMLIEGDTIEDGQAAPTDASPLESQRSWERQAEENLLARLESGGFLAPPGPVEQVLNTVVNNLIVSAKLNVQVHCRVLLSTPIETFTIGRTIVISRGLIDVLPDEASLAIMLSSELAHIALGHRTPTQFAFRNQTMLTDADLLQRVHFARTAAELLEASQRTIEIMRASPYQKTANAGLFLKALRSREVALPNLLAANIGNQVANAEALDRLTEFTVSAPELEEDKLEQMAALPLGSRVKLDPWSNRLELVKTRPMALLSAREKMSFEVTPFVLYLTRVEAPATAGPAQ